LRDGPRRQTAIITCRIDVGFRNRDVRVKFFYYRYYTFADAEHDTKAKKAAKIETIQAGDRPPLAQLANTSEPRLTQKSPKPSNPGLVQFRLLLGNADFQRAFLTQPLKRVEARVKI
jgi:hypothetical protein